MTRTPDKMEPDAQQLLPCTLCSETFTKAPVLALHLKQHQYQFKCRFCGRKIKTERELLRHEATHSGDSKYVHDSKPTTVPPKLSNMAPKPEVVAPKPSSVTPKYATDISKSSSIHPKDNIPQVKSEKVPPKAPKLDILAPRSLTVTRTFKQTPLLPKSSKEEANKTILEPRKQLKEAFKQELQRSTESATSKSVPSHFADSLGPSRLSRLDDFEPQKSPWPMSTNGVSIKSIPSSLATVQKNPTKSMKKSEQKKNFFEKSSDESEKLKSLGSTKTQTGGSKEDREEIFRKAKEYDEVKIRCEELEKEIAALQSRFDLEDTPEEEPVEVPGNPETLEIKTEPIEAAPEETMEVETRMPSEDDLEWDCDDKTIPPAWKLAKVGSGRRFQSPEGFIFDTRC